MGDDVHLWRVDLDCHLEAVPAMARTLASDELAKAAGLRFALHRNRYIVAHATLRAILARYLSGGLEPEFRYSPLGKPELADGMLYFNMSHSEDLALYAISRTCHIGVDVERVRPRTEDDCADCLSRRARQALERLPQPERRSAFFRGWTRMEAVVKAAGWDLELGLRVFEIFLDQSPFVVLPASVAGSRQCRWWLTDLCPRPGYVGALATAEVSVVARCRKWRPSSGQTPAAGRPIHAGVHSLDPTETSNDSSQ